MTSDKVTLTTEDQKLLERALMASTEKLYDINEETDGDRAIFDVLHGVAIGQLSPINSVEHIKALFAPILADNEAYRQNRHYVMGFNAGFEEACQQGLGAVGLGGEE